MDRSVFEIHKTIEQKPFEESSFARFFEYWSKENGSVTPKTLFRREWEKKAKDGMIQKDTDGNKVLLIPRDMRLWEMVGVMETLDRDISAHPNEKSEAMEKLGKQFRDAGIYIAQRLDSISEGKEIASALAEELYTYGDSLMAREKKEKETTLEEMKETELSPEEIAETDRFLAGDSLLASRQEREGDEEEKRRETLAQFFRVSKIAFQLEKKSETGELSLPAETKEPWQNTSPIHAEFLRKIEDALKRTIEIPKREMVDSVFQQGIALLRTNMPLPESSSFDSIERLISFWEKSEASIGSALGTYRMKSELEKIRVTGDIAAISKKEKEITDKIQQAVSSYGYEKEESTPEKAVATKKIDCVMGSMLGGSLLSQTGMKYLVGDIPEHSILIIPFSDGAVEWRDMIVPKRNGALTNEMLEGNMKEEQPLKVEDIAVLTHSPNMKSLTIDIKDEDYLKKFPWVRGEQNLTVFSPERGHKVQVLDNAGNAFVRSGMHEKAIETFHQSLLLEPKDPEAFNGLGNALFYTKKYEEAEKAYQKAIEIKPKDGYPYFGLGNVLMASNHPEDAVKTYQKFISLADKEQDRDAMEIAENIIKQLKK